MRKRLQFTNFLKSILILNEKEKEFTEEEINRSMVKDNTQINNSLNVDNIANSEIHENNDNILNKSILANQKEEKKQFYIDHLLINVEQFAGDVPLKKGQKDSGLQ